MELNYTDLLFISERKTFKEIFENLLQLSLEIYEKKHFFKKDNFSFKVLSIKDFLKNEEIQKSYSFELLELAYKKFIDMGLIVKIKEEYFLDKHLVFGV